MLRRLCQLDMANSTSTQKSNSSAKSRVQKPEGHKETKSQPTPARIVANVGQEGGEEKEKEKEKERKLFTGVFPRAGRPLPEVVLQTLFTWLRSSDLSALRCASSTAAYSPGER